MVEMERILQFSKSAFREGKLSRYSRERGRERERDVLSERAAARYIFGSALRHR